MNLRDFFCNLVSLLFYMLCSSLNGQEQIWQGLVIDNNLKVPIPYVNISILKSQEGASTDIDGHCTLVISDRDVSKFVKFSSLGYKDSTVSVSQLLEHTNFFLQPLTVALDEVIINSIKREKTRLINPVTDEDLCQGFGSHARNPWILGLLFPYDQSYESTDYLKTITMYFGNFKNAKSKFRLRLYSVGTNGLPDRDLLYQNVIVELKNNQKNVNIDLSENGIVFPRDGFFVAIEWLYIPYNAEKVTYVSGPKHKTKRKGVKYNPTFSGVCVTGGEHTLAVYSAGEWNFYNSKKYQSDENVIPAISLTLSN